MADIVTFKKARPDAIAGIYEAALKRCGRDIMTRTDKQFIQDILACVDDRGSETKKGLIFVDSVFVMSNPEKLDVAGDKPEETTYVGAIGEDDYGYVVIHHIHDRKARIIMKYGDDESNDEYLYPIPGYYLVDEDTGLYEKVHRNLS